MIIHDCMCICNLFTKIDIIFRIFSLTLLLQCILIIYSLKLL